MMKLSRPTMWDLTIVISRVRSYNTVDGRNPAPVDKWGLSDDLQAFSTIPGG